MQFGTLKMIFLEQVSVLGPQFEKKGEGFSLRNAYSSPNNSHPSL